MFFNPLKQLYVCTALENDYAPSHLKSHTHISNLTVSEEHPYLFCQKVYNITLIAFMPKCKKEMEQLPKSFLEDFSSPEGLLANWFELDMYDYII
jgi:hypothetical protein